MTPEERRQMNSLSTQIQEEKDYRRFKALLRELNDLVRRKESRFSQHDRANPRQRTRPWKTVHGKVQKIVKDVYRNRADLVEINIPAADHLFREIRIENTFSDIDGQQMALQAGTQLDITFEADLEGTFKGSSETDA